MRPIRILATLALAFSLSLTVTPGSSNASVMPSTAKVKSFPANANFDYQLGGSATPPSSVKIVVRDRTGRPAPGLYNVCYVNGFQTQPNEKSFWLRHQNLLLKKNGKLVSDSQWGEWIFDVRTEAKRKSLAKIVKPWISSCARKGFDGVEFDNLDSFSRSKGLIKQAHNIAFAKLLNQASHRAGLASGQKNFAGFNGTRIGFDFAVAEECARYDECGEYVRYFGSQVLMVEYSDADFSKACEEYGNTHPVVRRDLYLKPSYKPRYC